MNCANHEQSAAAAFCRDCGKPMCTACQRLAAGSVYCAEHVPQVAAPAAAPLPEQAPYASSPYTSQAYPGAVPPRIAAADPDVHPLLAFFLGFIPGVGAIYNGQYAKGLIHAVIFGLLVSAVSNSHNDAAAAFIGIMIAVWVMYQAFEAYHTARKRRYGMAVEEFSSLVESREARTSFPIGAIFLIGLGFLLLLDTTEIIRIERVERFWPALLIAAGIYLLYSRLSSPRVPTSNEARR